MNHIVVWLNDVSWPAIAGLSLVMFRMLTDLQGEGEEAVGLKIYESVGRSEYAGRGGVDTCL